MKGYMYILECSDDSYYTGSTIDLDLRLKQHEAGEGANHTKKHLPIKLVYFEKFDRIDLAFYREKQVQGWGRKKKEALIAGFQDKLPELSLAYRDLLSVASRASATVDAEITIAIKTKNTEPVSNYAISMAEALEATKNSRSRIIVISSPTPITKEASLINQLFDEGLTVFHLRKPESSSQELVLLLQEINPIHYSKIALHSHHYLAKSFGINRLHFNEVSRKQLIEDALETYNADGVILSTSIHSIDDYNQLSDKFDYAFLSPVFDSISKLNYKAQTFNLNHIHKKTDTKLIALGGIDERTCAKAFEMGFDGIALLGAIWNSEDKITAFKLIKIVSQIAQISN